MQPRLACLLLLTSTCVLCSDVSRQQRALEEELLRGLLAAQSAPYWSPVTLCTTLSNRRQDASSYEGEEGVRGRMEEKLQLLEVVDKLQVLQHLCEALQGRGEKLLQEPLEYLENVRNPLKRKSPYILKWQRGQTSKSRRPYILKRSTAY